MKKIILLFCLIFIGLNVNSQTKIGYINGNELLNSMPEKKVIDSTYQLFSDQLTKELNSLFENFNKNSSQFIKDSSTLLPSIKELRIKQLNEEAERIKKFQTQASKDLELQRQKISKPLLDKIKDAISKVAKEEKYDYIVDISTNPFVYFDNKFNIILQVQKKLNQKPIVKN